VSKLEDDSLLYNLSRAKGGRSSFSNKEFVFPQYDATTGRDPQGSAQIGFKDRVLNEDVIPFCAA